jgi:CHAT domain-containing protein/tetratricopeptide (TPR) repeat protein
LVVAFLATGSDSAHERASPPHDLEVRADQLERKWDLESYREAVRLYEVASSEWLADGDPGAAVRCLNKSAGLSQTLADNSAAESALFESLRIARAHRHVDSELSTLARLSLFYHHTGNSKGSKTYSDQAMAFTELSASPAPRAAVFFASGTYHYYHGKIAQARELLERSESEARSTNDPRLYGQILVFVGYVYLREGKLEDGLDKMNLAVEISNGSDDKRPHALATFGLGFAHFYLGKKNLALDLFKAADACFPSDFEWLERARIKSIIGNIYLELGALDPARLNYETAVELYGVADYEYGMIPALRMLSEVYHQLGRAGLPERTLRLAETKARSLDDTFELALISEQFGKLALSDGRSGEAITNLNRARRHFREVGVQFSSNENLLAKAHELNGDIDAAVKYFELAAEGNRKVRDSHQLADSLFHLARLDAENGHIERARDRIKESLDLTEGYQVGFSNPGLRRSYNSTASERYDLFIKLFMRPHRDALAKGFAEEALVGFERFRARGLVENLNLSEAGPIANAKADVIESERRILASLNAYRDRQTDLLRSDGDPRELESVEAEIVGLSGKLDDIRGSIRSKNPVYSAFKYAPAFDLNLFASGALGEEELLIQYFMGNEESYLWVVGKTDFQAFVLPPKEQIESKIDALRELLDARKPREGKSFADHQARVAEADAKYVPLARELSDLILGPVAERLSGKRLIVVPDGKLHYFPISALPMPGASSDDPILLTNEVVYQPSAQTYSLLKTLRSNKTEKNAKDLLVFSDPVFSPADERLTGLDIVEKKESEPYSYRLVESFSSLSRLRASGEEANSIAEIVGANADLVSGFDATRERLLNTNLADYRVVHLATHGFVDVDRPELSSVILSRFDQAGNPIDESIRMQDIYAMKLNADLVVLSACKTGTGKEIKGEGVMGLNTAFLQAGARSVVSTLWQVEDNAANHLMKEFYSQMVSGGMAPSAALRAAQIKLYQDPQFRSPFFWAAFTIQGDANTTPHFTRGYARSTVAAGAFAIIVILGFLIWKRRSVQRTSKL